MADFEKQSYWHERFASETAFEWLTSSAAFMDVLAPHLEQLPRTVRILHLGSGTSDLHNHLRQAGFKDITNIDYEPLALERGRQLERDWFGDVRMEYVVADATRLHPRGKYHVAIDKSTADAVACGGADAVVSMARGIRRCLRDDGFWISLSYSPSRFEGVHFMFEVSVISRVPTPKFKPTDPDIFHCCYLLRPKRDVQ
jgi:SAM-dependent methyltransferase